MTGILLLSTAPVSLRGRFWGIPVWMHPRLSSGSPLHPSLNSVGIPSGESPSSIKPEAAGAVLVPAAPLQPSIPSLPPSSSALFTPQAQQRRSHPSCAEFALQMSVPSQLAGGKPGPAPTRARLLGIPGLLRETQRHREPEQTCTCFSCCFRKPLWLLPPTSPAFIYSLSCLRWGFFLSFFPSPRHS